ncbi:manganese transporter [Tumebacillus avium]|uniref:Manganese transporter n=1 Tax=Tumebacillus avium TaxID=1903704 RepID=A0A1Y0ISS2_9BACL|nr:zinc ABC transporter substrate-binding protein [Tumebacillus avium]ARU63507.1 manganese transporter [Tumebacillus avium]
MTKRFLHITTLFVLMISVVLTGCGTEPAANDSGKLQVTATTGMIADLAQRVGGEHVEVSALMGPGIDPHLYKASQGDIQKLQQADIVLYNGLHLEGKMQEVFEQIGKQKPVVAVTDQFAESSLIASGVGGGTHDPHVWFDVKLWSGALDRIEAELIKNDAAHQADFEKNADAYREELAELDQYAREQLAQIPREGRVLVTAHDAFGYFGKAYDLEVVGLQGLSTDSEYGLKDVQNLVNLLVERKIKAVFVESSVPKKAIESVVKGAKAKGHDVKIGGELFSDAMGSAGTPEGTYPGMVRHNVDTIVKALK